MRIICFGHTIDPAYLSKKFAQSVTVLLPKHAKHLKKFFKYSAVHFFDFPKKDAIEDFSDQELLSRPAIEKAIRKNKATHFLISHRSSKKLFLECKKLGLIPIGNDYRLAQKLEDKLFFDSLLNQLGIKKPKTIKKSLSNLAGSDLPCVVQNPSSFGSFGTSIISNTSELLQLKKSIGKKSPNFLIRKFVHGNVYGITLVIHPNGSVLSAVRQQCYFTQAQHNSPLTFAGIQWIPSSFFAVQTKRSIERGCQKIGSFLAQKRFLGTIHFDFMVNDQGAVYFLECNPRPSSATPQLLQTPELFHGQNFSPILVGCLEGLPHLPFIPTSKYKGALFDLMIADSGKINPSVFARRQDLSAQYRHFFSLPTLKASPNLSFLGTIISSEPFFTKHGTLNARAKNLYKKYTGISL